jgi:TatD DNase family protein
VKETTPGSGAPPGQIVAYSLHGNCYLNITNRCTLRCGFCPKFRGNWTVQGYNLHLRHEPTVNEIVEAVGNPRRYREVVFCGLGEPTLRLYDALEAAAELRQRGTARLRLNTDGLASLVYGRDVTPDLEGLIDALSISLNAQDEDTYNRYCRPILPGAYRAMLDFADRARDFVPDVTLTAIDGLEGVDIAACEAVARRLHVKFRRRVLDEIGVETQ